ncbi:MAG: PIG-L family deacetylase [Polyangiaceae bacterium]|nr:PIG-L family deacetylase [Polyangiaceae bacterium]
MSTDPRFEGLCAPGGRAVPSVAVVAAHPDDETVGAGAQLRRWAAACPACHVIHVTDGAPHERRFHPPSALNLAREEYALLRRSEAVRALALAGLGAAQIACLGQRDQEVVFSLVEIAERLAGVLVELMPEVIVTHAYEGGHPDHDATAFAVRAAVGLARERRAGAPPLIVEMTGYHDRRGETVRGEFLPRAETDEAILELTADDGLHKRSMLETFASQRQVLQPFMAETSVERFRVAPVYDFTAPPHEGALHYESADLGPPAATWRAFAKAAARTLGLARRRS